MDNLADVSLFYIISHFLPVWNIVDRAITGQLKQTEKTFLSVQILVIQ